MRVRGTCIVGVISMIVGALVWATGDAAARSGAVACGPAHAKTLAEDRSARVYSEHGSAYGCARRSPGRIRLGSVSPSTPRDRVGPVALAGVVVAYGLADYGVDTVSSEVIVRRLPSGYTLRQAPSYSGTLPPESFETVNAVVVKRNSSVAWIATAGSVTSGNVTDHEVEKSDTAGGTLLDKSPRIKIRSLRLHGSRLSWRDGGAKQHATLQ